VADAFIGHTQPAPAGHTERASMSRVSLALLIAVAAAGRAADPVGGYTLPEDREAKRRLTAVTDYLAKSPVPWDVVCDTAQKLLDDRSDSFTVLPDGRRVSVKTRAGEILSQLPPDGRQFYELTFGPTAADLLKKATADGYDRAGLADLAQRFFYTKAGTQAAILLACAQHDAGEFPQAAYGFRCLLARPDVEPSPWLLARAAAVYRRAGNAGLTEEANAVLDRFDRAAPRDGLPVGRKTYPADEVRRLVRAAAARPALVTTDTHGRYGNPSHTGRGPAGAPFLDPAFRIDLFELRPGDRKDGADWVRDKLGETYKNLDPNRGQVALPGFFPVTADGIGVYRRYDGVYAVALRDGLVYDGQRKAAGQFLWRSEMDFGAQSLYVGDRKLNANLTGVLETGWRSYWSKSGVLAENTQTGSLSHDGKRVYCVDDWTIPPLPPQFNQIGGVNPAVTAPQGRGAGDYTLLWAIDLATGNVVWSLGGDGDPPPDDGPLDAQRATEGALFLGPPLAADGKLYLVFERDGQIKLACVNPDKLVPKAGPDPQPQPELLWVQGVGSPVNKLAVEPQRRTHALYPALADGVLVCPTNAGAVIAVDVNARTLLWARGYAAPADPSRLPGEGGGPGVPAWRGNQLPQFRPEPGSLGAVPADRWRAAAPIIADGKVVFAAYDSDQLQCLDLRSGEVLWADPRQKDDLYVGAVADGVVLVVGSRGVRGLKLHDPVGGRPAEAWPAVPAGPPSGHGTAGADGLYYLPLAAGGGGPADAAEPQVWAIHLASGAVRSKTTFRRPEAGADPKRALGNLVFHEGLLLAQSVDALTAFPLLGLKQDEMTRRLTDDAADPRGLLLRGELALDAGHYPAAVSDFRAALRRDPPADVRKAIRHKLYVGLTELLRTDFAAADPLLAEYEGLCEAVPESDDPAERQRAADETVRRKGLYLTLLARGRQQQGRTLDAAAAYLSYAGLGGGTPVGVPGEAVTAVRPDVWAAGRLADLLAAAPDADRAAFAVRAAREWDEVKAGAGVARLRAFVASYGPHVASGKQATVELADRLLAGGNPADRREALALLARLSADPDRVARAAATDRLAAASLAAGQPEHAVGLFAVVGREFADVRLPDGKTGAERLAGLLADRRLLPHLDATGQLFGGRYAAAVTPPPAVGSPASVGIRLDGPLLPTLRNVHLAAQYGGGDNRHALVATDRATGQELFRVADLSQSPGGFGAAAAEPVALAAGNLVLVLMGTTVHCLDLLERKPLWQFPLVERGPAAQMAPMVVDGEIEFSFDDGFKLRLGRSAVLRPGYAALVTRGGLVCLDPATRQTRWQRADVSPRVQVWGDDDHLFLVETAADGSKSSRVLRAADGRQVPNTRDFAASYTSGERLAVVGRHLLLDADGGSEDRRLRLYDPLTGADAWSRPVPIGAKVLAPADRRLTGFVTTDGRVVILNSDTGTPVTDGVPLGTDGRPLFANLAGRPVLLADADRVYLFAERSPTSDLRLILNLGGPPPARQFGVDGPAAAFDRRSGEVAWHSARLFTGRTLLAERFDDLPCLVTSTDAAVERPGEATRSPAVRVEVIDKATGRVRLHARAANPAGGFAVADLKGDGLDILRSDLRVRLSADPDTPGGP
jgi:outer membrane protein assembly factor BamB